MPVVLTNANTTRWGLGDWVTWGCPTWGCLVGTGVRGSQVCSSRFNHLAKRGWKKERTHGNTWLQYGHPAKNDDKQNWEGDAVWNIGFWRLAGYVWTQIPSWEPFWQPNHQCECDLHHNNNQQSNRQQASPGFSPSRPSSSSGWGLSPSSGSRPRPRRSAPWCPCSSHPCPSSW